MEQIKFELKLPEGPKSSFVVVAGGADADHDGTVEEDHEVDVFQRTGNVWSRTQPVQSPTTGMLFAVTFTVGPGVAWELTIKSATDRVLFHGANTTVFATETVSYHLA